MYNNVTSDNESVNQFYNLLINFAFILAFHRHRLIVKNIGKPIVNLPFGEHQIYSTKTSIPYLKLSFRSDK